MSTLRNKYSPVVMLTIIYGLEGIAANLAHPVTPTLLKNLAMPSYMFGLAFATMQLANFLFSPFWGNLCNYVQPRLLLLIGCVGYAFGQAVFGIAQGQTLILIGRALSGFFVSATSITAVYTLVKITTPDKRKQALPLLITSFVVMGTFGQFIGGVIGNANLYSAFILQVILLVVCGILFYVFVPKQTIEKVETKELIVKSNPVRSFTAIVEHLNPLFIVQFIAVFLMSFASTSISQTFGYYIVDVLNLGSNVNGIARGIVGAISVILNASLTVKIAKSRNVERYMGLLIILIVLSMSFMTFNPYAVTLFVIGAIVAMALDTMTVSIMQDMSSSFAKASIQGIVVGTHNSMKSLGAVVGALISGFIYDINAIAPFVLAAGIYSVGMILIQILKVLKQKNLIES